MTKSELPSSTPRSGVKDVVRGVGSSPRTRGSGYDEGTPDDYSTSDIGSTPNQTTPGSGFPSVTSNQQKANYAPQMEEYINNSKKK